MCTMILTVTLFHVLSIATITVQYKRIPVAGNDTDIFDVIKLLQDIADRSVTPTDDEPAIDENDSDTATDDDPEVDADYENWEGVNDEYSKKPKMENILRWLPKRHRVTKINPQKIEAERAKLNKLKARALNAKRSKYVINSMKTNYWATLYLWGEMTRILKERQILDDMRQMIRAVEKEGNEHLKELLLNCYRRTKKSIVNGVLWENKKTNNLIIDHLRHPDHEGIIT